MPVADIALAPRTAAKVDPIGAWCPDFDKRRRNQKHPHKKGTVLFGQPLRIPRK
jgi:hypothetical protein